MDRFDKTDGRMLDSTMCRSLGTELVVVVGDLEWFPLIMGHGVLDRWS